MPRVLKSVVPMPARNCERKMKAPALTFCSPADWHCVDSGSSGAHKSKLRVSVFDGNPSNRVHAIVSS